MFKKLLSHNKLFSCKIKQNSSNSNSVLLSSPVDHSRNRQFSTLSKNNVKLIDDFNNNKNNDDGSNNSFIDDDIIDFDSSGDGGGILGQKESHEWTKLEVKQLENLVEKLGENWDLVSKYMFTKSPVECFKKYKNLLSILPDHTKKFKHSNDNDDLILDHQKELPTEKSWKEEEIKFLNNLIEIHGRRWNQIIKHFPNKSSSEIENFLKNNPDKFPSLSKPTQVASSIRWPNDDIKILNDLVYKHRHDYDLISKFTSSKKTLGTTSTITPTTVTETTTDHDHLPWARYEINLLNELVETYGQNWLVISSKLPGRSATSCEFEYHLSWNQINNDVTSIANHCLSKEVIDAFNLLLKKYGKWQLVPLLVPGFTPLNCNSRNSLSLKTCQWSPEDKNLLKNIITEYGFDWDKIIPNFPYKKSNDIRQHVFKYLTKYRPRDIINDAYKSKPEVKWGANDIYQLFKLRYSGNDFTEISKKLKPVRTPLACYVRFYYISKYYESLNTNWSLMEVVELQFLYNKYGAKWKLIANKLENKRSVKEIKQFYFDYEHIFPFFNMSNFIRTNTTWNDEEIGQFTKLYQKYGPDWKTITKEIKTKKRNQCISFYKSNHQFLVEPTHNEQKSYWFIARKDWTKTDRDLLKDLLKKYGNDYGRLAEYFPGRTFKSIKNQATKMKKDDEGYVGLELDDNDDANTNHFNDGKLESNGRKRAIWSSSEIKKLVDLVRIYSGEWSKISEIMKNRSSDACSRKYYTLVYPEGIRDQSI
nr:8550_t:CDS:1 [Entrophospora candida]